MRVSLVLVGSRVGNSCDGACTVGTGLAATGLSARTRRREAYGATGNAATTRGENTATAKPTTVVHGRRGDSEADRT